MSEESARVEGGVELRQNKGERQEINRSKSAGESKKVQDYDRIEVRDRKSTVVRTLASRKRRRITTE